FVQEFEYAGQNPTVCRSLLRDLLPSLLDRVGKVACNLDDTLGAETPRSEIGRSVSQVAHDLFFNSADGLGGCNVVDACKGGGKIDKDIRLYAQRQIDGDVLDVCIFCH